MNEGGGLERLHRVTNPTGGVDVWREPIQPALHDDRMVRVMVAANLR